MHTSLYTQEPKKPGYTSRGVEDFAWWAALPAEWREMIQPPLYCDVFREPELAATRVFGYDADASACFYRHEYTLYEDRSDDGEEFYPAIVHAERLIAWRLRDERWLICRAIGGEEGLAQARQFYSFSETMPR